MLIETLELSAKSTVRAALVEGIHYDSLRESFELIEADAVYIDEIDSQATITGWVLQEENKISCQAKILPNGKIEVGGEETAQHPVFEMAMVLFVMRHLNLNKKGAELKRLLKSAPSWLDVSFRLSVSVHGWVASEGSKELPLQMQGLSDIQAYWELTRLAHSAKTNIPSDILVKHVLKLYFKDRWIVQLAAMNSLLRRISSVKKEELIIAKRPSGRAVFGEYLVRRKKSHIRPYSVLLASRDGLDGSCSCKDFQKNALGFCKHLATVFVHWYQNEKFIRRLMKGKTTAAPRITWQVETGMHKIVDPLSCIELKVQDTATLDGRAWARFFPKTKKGEASLFRVPKDKHLRQKLIKQFQAKLKKVSSSIVIDPVITPLLEKESEALSWPIRFSKRKDKILAGMKKINYKLYPYQKEGVKKALECGKFLLGDDMGLGKTVQGITWAECLLQAGEIRCVLVVCPAGLKTQWQREWSQASGREVCVVVGNPEDRNKIYNEAKKSHQKIVLVINYELVRRDLATLRQLNPGAVILDEAQRIKNYSTQTALTIKCLTPPFRLILTGTPMENRIQELSSLMDWIDDHAMGPTWRLESETRLEGAGEGHGPKGVRGLNLLREKLKPHFLRRLRANVLKDLPSRTDSPIIVPFTEAQSSIHDDFARKTARLAAIAATRPLSPGEHIRLMTLLAQMRIVSNALAQFEYADVWDSLKNDPNPERRIPQLDSPKLLEFRNLSRGLLSQEGVKIVVFSQWQRMLKLAQWSIHDVLESVEAEAVFFTGGESQKRRTENIIRFHDDPSVRIFFASDAGGVGLNLQKAATVCINLELPWNPAVLEQRIGRIHRLGQKKPVQVYNLITEGSIEERITALVGQKKAVFDELFDGSSDVVRYEEGSSFYDQVKNVIDELKIRPSEEFEGEESLESKVDPVCDDIKNPIEVDEKISLGETPLPLPETSESSESKEFSEKVINEEEQKTSPRLEGSDTVITPTVENVAQAFRGIKVQKSESGTLKIEASGESAKLLAGMFRGMAEMFDV